MRVIILVTACNQQPARIQKQIDNFKNAVFPDGVEFQPMFVVGKGSTLPTNIPYETLVVDVTDKNVVFGAPACTQRCAGEGELFFALIQYGPMLPELAEGVNRQFLPQFLPSFRWCWPNAEAWAGGRGPAARKCARRGAILG
jgi:hypothetical protein